MNNRLPGSSLITSHRSQVARPVYMKAADQHKCGPSGNINQCLGSAIFGIAADYYSADFRGVKVEFDRSNYHYPKSSRNPKYLNSNSNLN